MKEINNYCLYHLPKGGEGVNDVLTISFGEDNMVNERRLDKDIISMYHNSNLVGLAIMNFSSHAKIKINGTIFLPNIYLLNLINDYLHLNNIDVTLLEKENSGFIVGKILERKEQNKSYLYKIDIKKEILNIESTYELALNNLVVVATVGTYLYPGSKIQEYKNKEGLIIRGRICTYEDLQMNVNNAYLPLLMMEDELEIGQDFFMTEEVIHD